MSIGRRAVAHRGSPTSPSAEGPTCAPGQRLDVEFDLLGQEAVDCAAEIQQLVDRPFPLLGRQVAGDLIDQHRVEAGVAGFVDPVEPEDVPEQPVEVVAVAHVFDVVQLGEPLDHAREQQRGQR